MIDSFFVLSFGCVAWSGVAFLCIKHRWLCPSMFLLTYGYKDWLIGWGYSASGGFTDPVLHVSLWAALVIGLDLRVRPRWRCYDWLSIVCFLLLALWMIATLRWTRAPEYGAYKALRFTVFCGLAYVSGMTVRGEHEYRRMIWFLALGGIPLAMVLIFWPSISEAGRATIYGGGPLNAGLALSVPATLIFLMSHKFLPVHRRILRGAAAVLTIAIIPTGSRAFFGMPLMAFVFGQLSHPGSLAGKTLRSLVVLLVFVGVMAMDYDLGRAGRIDIEQTARAEQWGYTFAEARRSFLGYGAGDFGYVFNGFDARAFPHNFVLESWYELGVPGLLLLLFWWLRPIALYDWAGRNSASRRNCDLHTARELLSVFAITSIAILPHFDLADNRALYVTMGLAVGKLRFLRSRVVDDSRSQVVNRSRVLAMRGTRMFPDARWVIPR